MVLGGTNTLDLTAKIQNSLSLGFRPRIVNPHGSSSYGSLERNIGPFHFKWTS